MHLPRRLSASTLGDLLGTLYRGHTTGVLELRESAYVLGPGASGRVHRIHLYSGAVSGIETPLSAHPLGEMLQHQGLLPPFALERLLSKIERGDPRMSGVILIEEGLLPKELVRRGLHRQLREKIDIIYALSDAEVRFYTARPLSDTARRLGQLEPSVFLYGRPRARDRIKASGQRTAHKTAHQEETPPPASGVRCIDESKRRAYKTLGLSEDADIPTIRKTFRRMAIALHPDRFIHAGDEIRAHTTARFAEVSAAYHLLVA